MRTPVPVRLIQAQPSDWEVHGDAITRLIYATGPVSYGYQFGTDQRLLRKVLQASWPVPETLYAAANTTLALAGGELAGLLIGFAGPDFYAFKDNLAALAPDLLQTGAASIEDLQGLAERAEEASYLNAHLLVTSYYVLAISVTEPFQGSGIGGRLLVAAVEHARSRGFRELQLDVLSDNPAVRFYQAKGLDTVVETASPVLSRERGFPSELRMSTIL